MQIDLLNKRLIEYVEDDTYSIGLSSGKMGWCIYFYHLARLESNVQYEQIAERLLDLVTSQLSDMMDITVDSGLSGIALGIRHLIKGQFIAGEINDVLKEVDEVIFKKLAFLPKETTTKHIPKVDLLHLLYYLYVRYTDQTTSNSRFIYQELIIHSLELFLYDLHLGFFKDYFTFSTQYFHTPLFLFIIGKLYDLNIYSDRIEKILQEYCIPILSLFPLSAGNRLYLLWGLLKIRNILPDHQKKVVEQIDRLRASIQVVEMVEQEFHDQDIYMTNGLSAIYYLLVDLQNNDPDYSIVFDHFLFYRKMEASQAWNSMMKEDFYFQKYCRFYEGYPLAYLTFLKIRNAL